MGSSSTTSATSLTAMPSGAVTFPSMTHPVSVLEPTGTRTRAPTVGTGISSGTRYVSRSRKGTGTATEIRRMGRESRAWPVMRPETRISCSLSDRITGQARGARQEDTVRTSQGSAGISRAEPWLVQELSHSLHIFPDFALGRRRTEQVGRMIGGHEHRVAILVFAAAQSRDWIVRLQEALRRELAERDDHLGFHRVDLAQQERFALLHLVGLGIAIVRRTALEHVGDVDVLAAQTDRLDDFREKLAGAPDERLALNVFVRPGGLADEHQIRVGIAHA